MEQKPEEYSYSSYKSYVTRKRDEAVSEELLLSMISGNKRNAVQRYSGLKGFSFPFIFIYRYSFVAGDFNSSWICISLLLRHDKKPASLTFDNISLIFSH